jgi:hypothetical protein
MTIDSRIWRSSIAALLLWGAAVSVFAQAPAGDKKAVWKPVSFAIVKFNEEAPKSWNIYHSERKGVLLVHLWKRYLLVDLKEEEAYEIDPQTVKQTGDNVEWLWSDKPSEPLETPDWKTRDVGGMERIQFRLGKNGHILDLQIPLLPNGKTAY